MILVTGATGFIGEKVFDSLTKLGYKCIGISRRGRQNKEIHSCSLSNKKKLMKLMKSVSCIIHCAGYAHDTSNPSKKIKDIIWTVNFEGTRNLIEIAAISNVKRFIFLSSVNAMGNFGNIQVNEEYVPCPDSEYGRAKFAAENVIKDISYLGGISFTILRLAMVYGINDKGNLKRMYSLVKDKIFPPIPETFNHRSMVHISDAVSAIISVFLHPKSHNQVFIISGPTSPSGRELYNLLRRINGMPKNYFYIPAPLLFTIAKICDFFEFLLSKKLFFNSNILAKLLKSSWYSSGKIRKTIGWKPKISLIKGLIDYRK